jgi:tripartite-type tricarboxylate transporter receptor subunit TctC
MTAIRRRSALLGLSAALAAGRARAQGGFPDRPIRLVVPFAPGGTGDTMGRLLAEPLGALLGQPVVVENRPGGSTVIGAGLVARAAPDGHTLLYVTPNTQIINPHLMRNLPYDAERDLAPVIAVMRAPKLLVVNPALPVRDMPGLIALAKTRPLTYASSGVASSGHLAAAMLAHMAGVEMTHVPFRGTAPGVQEVIAGRVDLTLDTIATLLPLAREGRLRAIAVSTASRAPALPDLPAIAETLPGYEDASFNYIAAPGRTPEAVVARLNAALNAVLAQEAVQAKMRALEVEPVGGTPEELARTIRAESARWKRVIEAAGITAE